MMTKINIEEIEKEYKYSDDIMCDDNPIVFKYLDYLSDCERRIIIMYCELGSYSNVGRELGVSPSTVGNYIRKVQSKLIRCGLTREDFNN